LPSFINEDVIAFWLRASVGVARANGVLRSRINSFRVHEYPGHKVSLDCPDVCPRTVTSRCGSPIFRTIAPCRPGSAWPGMVAIHPGFPVPIAVAQITIARCGMARSHRRGGQLVYERERAAESAGSHELPTFTLSVLMRPGKWRGGISVKLF